VASLRHAISTSVAAYRDAGLDAVMLKVSLAAPGVMGSRQSPLRATVDAFRDQHLRPAK
jgi:hypothetical protein